MGFNIKDGTWDPKTFVWEGARWTPEMLAWRAFWMAVPFAVTLVAALFFDRFDTPRATIGGGMRRLARGRRARAPQPAAMPAPARGQSDNGQLTVAMAEMQAHGGGPDGFDGDDSRKLERFRDVDALDESVRNG